MVKVAMSYWPGNLREERPHGGADNREILVDSSKFFY